MRCKSIISLFLLLAIALPACCCSLMAVVASTHSCCKKSHACCCTAQDQKPATQKQQCKCEQSKTAKAFDNISTEIKSAPFVGLHLYPAVIFFFKFNAEDEVKNLHLARQSLPRPPSPQALLCLFRC